MSRLDVDKWAVGTRVLSRSFLAVGTLTVIPGDAGRVVEHVQLVRLTYYALAQDALVPDLAIQWERTGAITHVAHADADKDLFVVPADPRRIITPRARAHGRYSTDDIAELLGLASGTVRNKMSKAGVRQSDFPAVVRWLCAQLEGSDACPAG